MYRRVKIPIIIFFISIMLLLNSCTNAGAPSSSGPDYAPSSAPTVAVNGSAETAFGDFVIHSATTDISFDMINGLFGDVYDLVPGELQTPSYDISDTEKGYINAYVSDFAVFYGQADVSETEAKKHPAWYVYCDGDVGSFMTARGIAMGAAIETVKSAYPGIVWENYDCGYVQLTDGGWNYRIYFRFANNLLAEIDLSKESGNGVGAGLSLPGGEVVVETTEVDKNAEGNRGYADNGDGTTTYKDYDLGVKLTYPSEMTLHEELLDAASVVDDGQNGYLTVRNVTDEYWDYTGSNKKFVTNYITENVFADFETLYSDTETDFDMDVSNSDSDTTLAVGEVTIYRADGSFILARCVLQKVSFTDGDAFIFVRTQFAASEAQMDSLRTISLGGTRFS